MQKSSDEFTNSALDKALQGIDKDEKEIQKKLRREKYLLVGFAIMTAIGMVAAIFVKITL